MFQAAFIRYAVNTYKQYIKTKPTYKPRPTSRPTYISRPTSRLTYTPRPTSRPTYIKPSSHPKATHSQTNRIGSYESSSNSISQVNFIFIFISLPYAY